MPLSACRQVKGPAMRGLFVAEISKKIAAGALSIKISWHFNAKNQYPSALAAINIYASHPPSPLRSGCGRLQGAETAQRQRSGRDALTPAHHLRDLAGAGRDQQVLVAMLNPVHALGRAIQAMPSPVVDHIVRRAPLGRHALPNTPTTIRPCTGMRMGWRRWWHVPHSRAWRLGLGVPGGSGLVVVLRCVRRRWGRRVALRLGLSR